MWGGWVLRMGAPEDGRTDGRRRSPEQPSARRVFEARPAAAGTSACAGPCFAVIAGRQRLCRIAAVGGGREEQERWGWFVLGASEPFTTDGKPAWRGTVVGNRRIGVQAGQPSMRPGAQHGWIVEGAWENPLPRPRFGATCGVASDKQWQSRPAPVESGSNRDPFHPSSHQLRATRTGATRGEGREGGREEGGKEREECVCVWCVLVTGGKEVRWFLIGCWWVLSWEDRQSTTHDDLCTPYNA